MIFDQSVVRCTSCELTHELITVSIHTIHKSTEAEINRLWRKFTHVICVVTGNFVQILKEYDNPIVNYEHDYSKCKFKVVLHCRGQRNLGCIT